jgi:ABC-type antimicrobial peptide transport system ATPase subunit
VAIEQYTDNTGQLKVNDKYGSFKITEVNSNRIVLQNTEKITMPLNKVTTILDNHLKFQMEESRYYGYPFVEMKARAAGSI